MKNKNNFYKLIILLIVIISLPISSFGFNNNKILKISIKVEDATLSEIFSTLSKESKVNISYGQSVINDKTKYNAIYSLNTLEEILANFSIKAKFKYKIDSEGVLIQRELQTNSETKTVKLIAGVVVDKNGFPIPGASILEKGTQNGAITNSEGEFSISISDSSNVLVISFIGYITNNFIITGSNNVKIQLSEDLNQLNEVIVVGYGKQKRGDVTGAISSISKVDISENNSPNTLQALKGKIAGVDVINGGNEPGSDAVVRIRGQRSIGADNSPLVVLDGIPIIGGLNEINPNDIASMEVLKDASATAIYGSRASNGVILLTTKRGTTGKTTINFSTYSGLSTAIKRLDLMNGEEFAQLRREANRTVSSTGEYPADTKIFDNIGLESIALGRETDWQKLIYGTGVKRNYQLSVNGGDKKTQFNISFNYYNEKGIVETSKFERGSLRINLDHKINDKIKVGVSSFITRSKQDVTQNDLYDNILRLSPLGIPYDESGKVLFRPTNDESQRVNPFSDINNSVNDRFKTRVFASFYTEYNFSKSLSYRLNLGSDMEFNRNGYFYGSNTTQSQGGSSTAGIDNGNTTSATVENILNFKPNLGDKHAVVGTFVQSYQNQTTRSDSNKVGKIPFDSQTYNNLGSAGEVLGVGSNYQKWQLLSYTGRFNYQFDERYLITLTGRADGSSRLSEDNKWGFFPSAAIAWRLSKEPFFNIPTNVISNLKFRLSYGKTGNTAIKPYQTLSLLSKSYYAFGNSGAPGFIPSSISNPELKWETTNQTNFGLDFEIWNRKVSGSINYYKANTSDLLLPRGIPKSSGFTTVLENIGATSNEGLEINLSLLDIIPSENFKWEADFTFSTNKNKITKIYGDGKDDIGNKWFIGQPINVFYDYKKIGIWQTEEATTAALYGFKPGQIKVEDINKDGAINSNDRVVLGSTSPKWIGGLTNRFSYKAFSLSTSIVTRQKNLTSSQFYDNNNRLAGRYNNIDVNYWTPENATNENPRPNVSQEGVYLGSTLTYKDVSFVRVKNIVLTYSLPETYLKMLKLSQFSLNLTAENPFTITNYKGFDPEFESNGERALYPSTKTIFLGLNINF